jgi:hemerythrin-like metal-binding protein
MEFYTWKDEYASGINGIDNQHKVILKLMSKLHESITVNSKPEVMKHIFIELLEYANYHFGLEMRLLKTHNYMDKQKHIEEHEHFINKVKTLMIHGYLNNNTAPLETLEYLKKWFTNHMLKTDMEYCKYFIYKEINKDVEQEIVQENLLLKKIY